MSADQVSERPWSIGCSGAVAGLAAGVGRQLAATPAAERSDHDGALLLRYAGACHGIVPLLLDEGGSMLGTPHSFVGLAL